MDNLESLSVAADILLHVTILLEILSRFIGTLELELYIKGFKWGLNLEKKTCLKELLKKLDF